MESTEKIKGKIKALLSKTIDNGATKEEMESALQKANQLMTSFFISEHDLKDEIIINKCISESFDIVNSGFDLTIFYADLAFLFDCECYFTSKKITFFGHETDVAMCGYFYVMICKTCLAEKNKFLKSYEYESLKYKYHGRSLSANFIRGFLLEVVYKIKAMYAERQSNIPQSFGLMVIKKQEKVKEEFLNLDLKINTEKAKVIKAENLAFNYGSEAGEKLELIQGIETHEKKIAIEI